VISNRKEDVHVEGSEEVYHERKEMPANFSPILGRGRGGGE
jgi:hypothetical protein